MGPLRYLVALLLWVLAACMTPSSPSQAGTGTVRILLGTAAVVVGVGNGTGTLTFEGKTYSFEVSGASFGATLTQAVSELDGEVRNLRRPEDLAGNYIAVGLGGALVGGAGIARLRNAKGVTLVLRGPKMGVGLSVNLAKVTITM
ncbi:hypothetical protein QA645_20075 [Bradyrhizobium sp. CIAT3101]|uniref:hypothetical protein n=1 Tax=Bradyrhizobium sp. CIAT3101 TaxID=439387 RepID=UPI0024B04E50|nr:hypothetical protein [Bradyrhizobium sp. CIAT3101]WFU84946.1 hypothetical protein QA645_20075 [Bradyrhizobium sp. CIAT3101]